jgi:hypothetical protein
MSVLPANLSVDRFFIRHIHSGVSLTGSGFVLIDTDTALELARLDKMDIGTIIIPEICAFS